MSLAIVSQHAVQSFDAIRGAGIGPTLAATVNSWQMKPDSGPLAQGGGDGAGLWLDRIYLVATPVLAALIGALGWQKRSETHELRAAMRPLSEAEEERARVALRHTMLTVGGRPLTTLDHLFANPGAAALTAGNPGDWINTPAAAFLHSTRLHVQGTHAELSAYVARMLTDATNLFAERPDQFAGHFCSTVRPQGYQGHTINRIDARNAPMVYAIRNFHGGEPDSTYPDPELWPHGVNVHGYCIPVGAHFVTVVPTFNARGLCMLRIQMHRQFPLTERLELLDNYSRTKVVEGPVGSRSRDAWMMTRAIALPPCDPMPPVHAVPDLPSTGRHRDDAD